MSFPSVRTPTCIAGNAMTRSNSGMRELLDLGEEVVRDLDAVGAQLSFGGEAPRAGQAHALVGEHRRDHRLDALEIALVPGERAGVNGEKSVADARPVARLREEGVGLGPDRRAGERRADE